MTTLKERIETCEKELAAMKKELEQESSADCGLFLEEPEWRETYYYHTPREVNPSKWIREYIDQQFFLHGNCFKTYAANNTCRCCCRNTTMIGIGGSM